MSQINITEERFKELLEKEQTLNNILKLYPEILIQNKLTPKAKIYKNALEKLVNKLVVVCRSPEFIELFQMAYLRGIEYNGPTFELEFEEAKKLLKKN